MWNLLLAVLDADSVGAIAGWGVADGVGAVPVVADADWLSHT